MKRKIALIGLGYIGKIHLRLLKESAHWDIAGIYDLKQDLTAELAAQYDVPAMASLDDAIAAAEAVDIATPSGTHFTIASQAVKAGRHVFVEKPVTSDIKD